MAKKKIQRVVVDKTYLELLERKAQLLDGMFDGDIISFTAEIIKEYARIEKACNKGDFLGGAVEPYEEPKEK
jgi:hypothetical protein